MKIVTNTIDVVTYFAIVFLLTCVLSLAGLVVAGALSKIGIILMLVGATFNAVVMTVTKAKLDKINLDIAMRVNGWPV